MSAKLLVKAPFGVSGTTLLWTLFCIVVGVAMGFDFIFGHFPSINHSITVPLLISFIGSAALGKWAVPWLQDLKTGQVIREEGPQTHQMKAGTPTMGGLFFIPVALLVSAIATGFSSSVLAAIGITLLYGAIGWLDDWQVIQRRSNKGISPSTKILLQIGGAIVFTLWLFNYHGSEMTSIHFPFGFVLPLGTLFWLLAGFVPVAQSNATNLTDGLDGLAAGTSALAFLGLAILANASFPGMMVLSACLSGACLGFLIHNRNPAQVFMGDTGSLAIGGAMAAIALISGQLFGLFILSGIFFAESLSVMLQVGYFKATKNGGGAGKRLFKMAPLHHHFELSGWSELKVVGIFYGITAVFMAAAIGLCGHYA